MISLTNKLQAYVIVVCIQSAILAVTNVTAQAQANVTSVAASKDIPSTKPPKSAKVRIPEYSDVPQT